MPPSFSFESDVDNENGAVEVSITGTRTANLDSVILAHITFDVLGEPDQFTELVFSDAFVYDSSTPPENILVTTVNGLISVHTVVLPSVPVVGFGGLIVIGAGYTFVLWRRTKGNPVAVVEK